MYAGTGVIFTDPNRRRFLLQRKEADYPRYPGHYCFFGGEVEAGEHPRAAMLRETEEELGIFAATLAAGAVQVFDDIVVLPERRYAMTLFEVTTPEATLETLAAGPVYEGEAAELRAGPELLELPFVWGLEVVVDAYLQSFPPRPSEGVCDV